MAPAPLNPPLDVTSRAGYTMGMDLGERTLYVLRFIGWSVEVDGRPPTLREIAQASGMASTNGSRYHLKRLAAAGLIERDPIVTRGIRLTPAGRKALQ